MSLRRAPYRPVGWLLAALCLGLFGCSQSSATAPRPIAVAAGEEGAGANDPTEFTVDLEQTPEPVDPAPVTEPAPLAAGQTLVARAKPTLSKVAVFDGPNGHRLPTEWTITNPTFFGSPLVLRVLEGREFDEWVRVELPVRPNGTAGWIKTHDFDFSVVDTRIEIALGERRLRAYNGEILIVDTPVVIGRSSTPTPLGTFFLNERLKRNNPAGAYGPWILGLSAFSETLAEFDGGIPVIAIHGTNQPELVGQARSNGCVRVPNDSIEQMARALPLGTPVTIVG